MAIEKRLKPAEFAEKKLVEAILDLTYQPGSALPAERDLARLLGVTRPTVREVLQRLSKEGWLIIQHGKATRVNDYMEKGGLGILHSLARHGRHLSSDMISHLLEVRAAMFPDIARKAAASRPREILQYLKQSSTLPDQPLEYARYDRGLQVLMVKMTQNPVFKMILNDFAPLYAILGERYFFSTESRKASLAYYKDLILALEQQNMDVKPIVEKIMIKAQEIWKDIR